MKIFLPYTNHYKDLIENCCCTNTKFPSFFFHLLVVLTRLDTVCWNGDCVSVTLYGLARQCQLRYCGRRYVSPSSKKPTLKTDATYNHPTASSVSSLPELQTHNPRHPANSSDLGQTTAAVHSFCLLALSSRQRSLRRDSDDGSRARSPLLRQHPPATNSDPRLSRIASSKHCFELPGLYMMRLRLR